MQEEVLRVGEGAKVGEAIIENVSINMVNEVTGRYRAICLYPNGTREVHGVPPKEPNLLSPWPSHPIIRIHLFPSFFNDVRALYRLFTFTA